MNQEKETMQTSSAAGEYLAPRVEVVEVKARRVVCTSPSLNDIGKTDGSW